MDGNGKFILAILVAICVLLSFGIFLQNESWQSNSIIDLQKVVGQPAPVVEEPESTWQAIPIETSVVQDDALVQIDIRNRDGSMVSTTIGITDAINAVVGGDWRAVPTKVSSGNSLVVWRDESKRFHCKVQ